MKITKLISFTDRLQGLSFKTKIHPVYFKTRWGIHTFFVKKPIDIIICDEKFIVKVIKRNLKPWRVFIWNPMYRNVIEGESPFLPNHKVGQPLKIN